MKARFWLVLVTSLYASLIVGCPKSSSIVASSANALPQKYELAVNGQKLEPIMSVTKTSQELGEFMEGVIPLCKDREHPETFVDSFDSWPIICEKLPNAWVWPTESAYNTLKLTWTGYSKRSEAAAIMCSGGQTCDRDGNFAIKLFVTGCPIGEGTDPSGDPEYSLVMSQQEMDSYVASSSSSDRDREYALGRMLIILVLMEDHATNRNDLYMIINQPRVALMAGGQPFR